MDPVVYIVIGVVVVLLLLLILTYNSAAKKRLRVENAFSQIKIQCKRKINLVPYLVDIVKEYAKNVDLKVGNTYITDTPKDLADADIKISQEMKSLLSVVNRNPALKKDANFLQLQSELASLEKAIAISCGFYNDAVMIYNRTVKKFPINIIAKMFRLKPADFLDLATVNTDSMMKGMKCPSCGAASNSSICPHCGTRIPLM